MQYAPSSRSPSGTRPSTRAVAQDATATRPRTTRNALATTTDGSASAGRSATVERDCGSSGRAGGAISRERRAAQGADGGGGAAETTEPPGRGGRGPPPGRAAAPPAPT